MSHLFPPPIVYSIITFICILIVVPASLGDDDEWYRICSSPWNYTCGPLSVNGFPFWANNSRPRYCGRQGFELECEENRFPTIVIGYQRFRVLEFKESTQLMKIARADIRINFCPGIFQETIIDQNLFSYSGEVRNLSVFFDCGTDFTSRTDNNSFSCSSEHGFYTIDGSGDQRPGNLSNSCSRGIKIPVQLSDMNIRYLSDGKLGDVLHQGFELTYNADDKLCRECSNSEGICGSNQTSKEFWCLCRDKPCLPPRNGSGGHVKLKVGIGMTAAITASFIVICIFCSKKKNSSILSKGCGSIKVTKSEQDLEAFIRNYGPLALNRYNFSDIKKMTNCFKDKLGQGGYGDVYKGKLSNGRLVAVKLLNASKGNGQEFINEVASISRTSHVNVVTLLGFCLEGSKRALIYEFMPNGSLEKFIYNGASKPSHQPLGWEKMYEIVIGIARGLEYLHRGCNTRILHFDIKPHNILLDEDFCPKISDFGMAKLCLTKESIVSMMEARGTIGYIAPEVFSRNFGGVSHKSDVYSYGMMILELVGCKNNFNTGADRSSEIYFPHWIYKQFERDKKFEVPGIATSEENEIAKKIVVVGLWCIQTCPSDRPSVNRVIEMLQSSTDALQIPPKPFASSPPRPRVDSSNISTP